LRILKIIDYFWKKYIEIEMLRFFEEKYPFIGSAVLLLILYFIEKDFVIKVNFQDLLNSSLVVFSVLLGFLLTVATILHTIDNPSINIIRQTKSYPRLMGFLNTAIYSSLIITILSLIIPLIKNISLLGQNYIQLTNYLKLGYLFFILFTILVVFRFIRIFLIIISNK